MHCDRQEWHLLKAALERVDVIMPSVTGNGTDIALVRECEGILYSEKKMWNLAFAKFHESFTKFCESNHDRRAELLMYVLLLLWWWCCCCCCCCGGGGGGGHDDDDNNNNNDNNNTNYYDVDDDDYVQLTRCS